MAALTNIMRTIRIFSKFSQNEFIFEKDLQTHELSTYKKVYLDDENIP